MSNLDETIRNLEKALKRHEEKLHEGKRELDKATLVLRAAEREHGKIHDDVTKLTTVLESAQRELNDAMKRRDAEKTKEDARK